MRPALSDIPYVTYPREQTGNIIMVANFEEGNLLSETFDDAESVNRYDDYSNLKPLISEE